MKKLNVQRVCLILILLSLALMLTPWGVAVIYGPGPDTTVIQRYSYIKNMFIICHFSPLLTFISVLLAAYVNSKKTPIVQLCFALFFNSLFLINAMKITEVSCIIEALLVISIAVCIYRIRQAQIE